MIEPSTHDYCPNPNCQNADLYTKIYQCDAGYLFCEKCAEDRGIGYLHFETCRIHKDVYIGRVEPPSQPKQDLKEWDVLQKFDRCPRCKCNRHETKVYICFDGHPFCEACQQDTLGDLVQCAEPGCNRRLKMHWPDNGGIIT